MDYINDLFKQLLELRAEALVALLCLVAGYICRKIRIFPNRFIPLICLLVGGVVYPFLVPLGEVSPVTSHPIVRLVIIGVIIGFGTWALIKPLEQKFPWLKAFLDGQMNGDTQIIEKPK